MAPPDSSTQTTDPLVAINVKKSASVQIALMTVASSFILACPPENMVVSPVVSSRHRTTAEGEEGWCVQQGSRIPHRDSVLTSVIWSWVR